VAHPELSRAIGDRKLTGYGPVARAHGQRLSRLHLQLQDIIDRAGLQVKAVHTLELVNQAMNETPMVPRTLSLRYGRGSCRYRSVHS
jgi:glycolate oxidase iron-sulfur subunit